MKKTLFIVLVSALALSACCNGKKECCKDGQKKECCKETCDAPRGVAALCPQERDRIIQKAVDLKNDKPNTLSAKEKAAGWKLLWDGKTSAGWRSARGDNFPDHGWKMADGILTVEAADGAESGNGGDIITVDEYANFILKVDFRITPGANSGIKYFVDPGLNKGPGSAIGCEFQILDDQLHPDAKLGVKGNRTQGSLYDLIPSRNGEWDAISDADGFKTAMVVVMGNHVEHWLNGVKILQYERNNEEWNALVAYSKYRDWPNFGNHATGHILLQDHGNEVCFRNVKIKVLD